MYKHKNASEYGVEGIYKNREQSVEDNKNSTEKQIAIKKNSMIYFLLRTLSLRRTKNKKTVTKKVDPNSNSTQTTRQGENEVRSRGARDRRALTGEAGNASRRKVIEGDAGMNPV
ncbi:MAG: hypothetical protein WAL30_05365, partial [Candidatus Aquirickettsiella sp.]